MAKAASTTSEPQLESATALVFEDWGLVEYELALKRQLHYVEEVQKGERLSTLVFCTHPPVVTLGRATEPNDCYAWQGKTVEVSRGGRATYHGPSQLVIYPIIDLNMEWGGRKARDIVGYLRALENAIVEVLSGFGLAAEGRSVHKKDSGKEAVEETGVWIKNQKIASLGIGVKRWVAFHGAAINLDFDSRAYQGMNPCGFQSSVMVSLEQLLGEPVDRQKFSHQLQLQLLKTL